MIIIAHTFSNGFHMHFQMTFTKLNINKNLASNLSVQNYAK